jgi:uncharacterized protein
MENVSLWNPSIKVGSFGPRGRGVVAQRAFRKGEVIESAPVLVIPEREWQAMENTTLYNYGFAFGEGTQDMAIAFGFGSLYNHSYQPNARYIKRISERTLEYVAIRDIQCGEEITINYNGRPEAQDPLWFEVIEDKKRPQTQALDPVIAKIA